DRLAVMHAEDLSVGSAFGLSYQDLTAGPQRLFRHLGLVPGTSIDAYAAAALDGTSLDQARRCLGELYNQHLLAEPAPGRYQLHHLAREPARPPAAADDPTDTDPATPRLLDYYLHTTLAAGQHLPGGYPDVNPLPPARLPEFVPPIAAPGQAVDWVEAE